MNLIAQSSLVCGLIVVITAAIISYVESSAFNTIVNGKVLLVLGGWGILTTILHFVTNYYLMDGKFQPEFNK